MRALHHQYVSRDFFIFMEISVFAIILGLVTSVASYYYLQLSRISITTAAISVSGSLKSEIHAFYIENGYWPDTDDFTQLSDYLNNSNTVSDILIEKGSFHLKLNKKFGKLGGKVLSFRKAQFSQQLDAPIWWICGYSKVPDGMNTNVDNKTNIDKTYLLRTCQ